MITDTRRKMLAYIHAHKQVRPHDLVYVFEISQVAIHKHLKTLLAKGDIRKVGKAPFVFYMANRVKKPTFADTPKTQSPYFLWDYNLTDAQIHAIITGSNTIEKQWLIARILTHARFEDVFSYLTIADIIRSFPQLALSNTTRDAWKRALTVWGYHV